MNELIFRSFRENENGKEIIEVNGKKIKGDWINNNGLSDNLCICTMLHLMTKDLLKRSHWLNRRYYDTRRS